MRIDTYNTSQGNDDLVATTSLPVSFLNDVTIWWPLDRHPCCNDPHTHLFTKILGEKLGYNKDYKNANVNIWMLDKEVDMWGNEFTMETPHIEWCFQFEKWMDLNNVKYAHVVNLKAYKDDL